MPENPSSRKILFELCTGSVEDAVIAERNGADRVELCSALMLGGLSPSAGMIAAAKRHVSIPVMAMIRPRGAGFCYGRFDFEAMLDDVQQAVRLGADGIVFGILLADGRIDLERSRELIARVPPRRQIVFHRAFDVVPEPREALEQLIELGVTRVLTSGQEDTVYDGTPLIAELIRQAGDRITVMPGGGINRFNLADVIERTGCREIHIAAATQREDTSVRCRPQVTFGGSLRPPEDLYPVADAALVARLARAIKG